MALRPYAGFVGPSYTLQSKIAAYDRTVNWFPERIESGTGQAAYWLVPTPGYSTSLTLGDSPGRGSLTNNGDQYLVSGTTFYSGITSRGTVSNLADAPAYMVTNGDPGGQVLIASDAKTYAYNTTTHLLTLVGTITVSTSYVSIGFLSGIGLRLDPDLSEVQFSATEDFTSWDPLDIFRRVDAPDRWVRLLVFHNEIWLFGTNTSSIYYFDADDEAEPFKKNPSAFIQTGIMAPWSACIVDGSPMWIGRNENGWGIVYRANGYTPDRISTHAVEYALQQLANDGRLHLAEGSTYQENGHVFYELSFPSLSADVPGATWVYDSTAGLWHERGAWDGLQYVELDTRGHFTSAVGGEQQQQTLSRTSGKIYTQSLALSTGTDGLGMRRLRRAPHINKAQQRIRYSHLRLLMETGLGLGTVVSTAPGYDPSITLRWSNDGGQTFGASFPASTGRIGAYSQLVEWRQLEQAQDRIFELACSAPVPYRLIDAFLDYSVGPS